MIQSLLNRFLGKSEEGDKSSSSSCNIDEQVNFLTIVDHRTGKEASVPIDHESPSAPTIPSTFFNTQFGIQLLDPAYQNTAVIKSSISWIDGEKGVLEYRGYPIEQLAEQSSFLEVAYLLIYGELPGKASLEDWQEKVMKHTYVHTNLTKLMSSFHYDAHPMGMFISTMAALSTFHADANPSLAAGGADLFIQDDLLRNKQIVRILGKSPTIAAAAYRHRIGRSPNLPRNDLGYCENLLYMMDQLNESDYKPHPVLSRALDQLFILHAEHEMNCSTAAMRHIASSRVDPYSAIAGAASALYGPLHGGANEAVLRMLQSIGSVEQVPAFIDQVKTRRTRLMGFGHRIYRSYDPRARIIQRIAYQVFEVCGREPLVDIALALEHHALRDEYFIQRRLYPNVDFYSGLIYRAMGFPTDFFPVLFAIPRVVGWLAHWREQLLSDDNKIWRPRQVYIGPSRRDYVPLSKRKGSVIGGDSSHNTATAEEEEKALSLTKINTHPFNKRYTVSTMSKL